MRVLKVERLIEKVEKKNAEAPNHARGASDVPDMAGSGNSRRGSAMGLAAMLISGKNDQRRSSSR